MIVMKRGGFAKGLVTGAVIGSALGMMFEKPDPRTVSRMRRKTMRTVRNIGCAVEDLVSGN